MKIRNASKLKFLEERHPGGKEIILTLFKKQDFYAINEMIQDWDKESLSYVITMMAEELSNYTEVGY